METIIKVLLLIGVSVLLSNSGGDRDGNFQYDGTKNAPPSLVRARSSDDLEKRFKASLVELYGTLQLQRSDYYLASGDTTASPASAPFSMTTRQESSVDESDRLKTDGQYIYVNSMHKPSIKIFEAKQGRPSLIAELAIKTLSNNELLSGLYLRHNKKQLIAIAGDGRHGSGNSWLSSEHWKDRKTELFTVDISSPAEPALLGKLSLDGQLISSRRIGSVLYVATSHTVKIPHLIDSPQNHTETALNRILIAKTPLDDMLPKYRSNGQRHALFDAENCFFTGKKTTNYTQHSIISLLAIDLDNAASKPKGQCFIGDAETVYASANAIYLATTQYQYANKLSDVIYEGSPTTEIHKFSLDGMQTNYVGSASIDGHLGWQQSLKSFRMSEHNGVLRVLSYVGEQADSIESPARLHVLRGNANNTSLDIIGTLPNASRPEPLGKKGEQIYASHFMGKRGYLVTFRATDPLYLLDISDPTDPYILSALELDGHSDYLQPIGKNFLLGIGKDAVAQTSGNTQASSFLGAWDQGVKLSLIDISNPSAPIEKQKIILGKRGTQTAVSTTHHALTTLLKGDNLQVNLPVSLHDTKIENENYSAARHPSDYFGWTEDVLYRLNIDINSGEISVLTPIVAEMADEPENKDYYQTDWQHDRSAIIDDDTYYLKRDEIFTLAD